MLEEPLAKDQRFPAEKKGAAKHILIVDDDDDYVASLKLGLEAHGYALSRASNKDEVMANLEKGLPDLIIMDVMLEHMCDGFDISRKLKSNEKYGKIPIVMITAVGEKTGFQYSPDSGDRFWLSVDAYMSKPPKLEELVAKIEALCSPQEERS